MTDYTKKFQEAVGKNSSEKKVSERLKNLREALGSGLKGARDQMQKAAQDKKTK